MSIVVLGLRHFLIYGIIGTFIVLLTIFHRVRNSMKYIGEHLVYNLFDHNFD